jgi:para-nitrobenzyl esterase
MSSPHDTIRLAERKANQAAAPVFMYLFAWETPAYGGELQTPHMLEVPFVFNNVEIAKEFTGGGARAQRLARTICDAWAEFARSGTPGAEGMPIWQPYTKEQRNTMIIDDQCEIQSDPGKETRLFWNSFDDRTNKPL